MHYLPGFAGGNVQFATYKHENKEKKRVGRKKKGEKKEKTLKLEQTSKKFIFILKRPDSSIQVHN